MSTCCSVGLERMFGKKQARRDARRFRRKGLDATARRLVDSVARRGIDGASVLEVGGGVGGIEIELLRAGAARATNVELSPGYEDEARVLLAESGFEGRVERKLGDFVDAAEGLDHADVVVLHRVVCCYPDEIALVSAAAGRSLRLLALSFPRDTWLIRTGAAAANIVLRRLFGFQIYVRPGYMILAPAEARGFRVAVENIGFFWRYAVLERG